MYRDIESKIKERYSYYCTRYADAFDDCYGTALDIIEEIVLYDFEDKNLHRELGKIYRAIVDGEDD